MHTIGKKVDPATLQTASGYPEVKKINTTFKFSENEITMLRDLAKQVATIANNDTMFRKAKLWTLHNDLKSEEPLVFIDPENGWNECIESGSIKSVDPLARVWEMHLRKQIYWAEMLKDDKVIEPYFDVPYSYNSTGWGVDLEKIGGDDGGSYIVKQAIEDYENDFEKIHHPQFIVDWRESNLLMDLANSVFDGILTVRRKNIWWWSLGLTIDYIALRGLEDFMCDLILEPEWVHRMMDLLCNGKLEMLDSLEEQGLLSQNTYGTYVGSGGFGYTNFIKDVPAGQNVKTQDMWGFCESQETSSVSSEFFKEFIIPYHNKILSRFALNCYGCCEAFDTRWSHIKELPNLRRISCSPFSDWSKVPELLKKDYIASVKPNPTPLATNYMNEEVVRSDCKKMLEQTKGSRCEFIMKDNNTLGKNPNNAVRWVEIMREEIYNTYK